VSHSLDKIESSERELFFLCLTVRKEVRIYIKDGTETSGDRYRNFRSIHD